MTVPLEEIDFHEAMTDAELKACVCPDCARCSCPDKHDPNVILILTRKGLAGWLKVSEGAIRKAEAERRIERRDDGCYDYHAVIDDWIRNTRPKRLCQALRRFL